MADDSGDFGQLPPRVQRAIDAAFDAANGRVRSARREAARPSPRKRRRLDASISAAPGGFMADEPPIGGGFLADDAPTGGGFLPDEASASAGAGGGGFINDLPPGGGFINELTAPSSLSGGFVVDDEDAPAATHTHIALERIPGALQALDLSPDDADVLAIFHNAASGWGAGGPGPGSGTGGVARKDWRAVCAVLLAGRPEETFPEIAPSDDEPESGNDDDGDDGDGDEYMGTEEESDSELSPLPSEYEDYGASATARGAGKKAAKGKKSKGAASGAATDGVQRLTARQQRESRATFALFFPDVPDERLDAQRIRIRDVSRVADLLKEKITAEEIIEMLTEFSTAPDKSMGLADFEQVLVLAQLV